MYKFILFIIFTTFIMSACNSSLDHKKEPTQNMNDTLIEKKKKEQTVELATLDKPYNPEADARKDILALIDSAEKYNKNIILQAGGNWCIWCLRFEKFRKENSSIQAMIDSNYFFYHLNYSEENKNEEILNYYGNPGKLGYPVFIVLDKKGRLIHTQGSEVLEDGVKGYDSNKVMDFLNDWRPI